MIVSVYLSLNKDIKFLYTLVMRDYSTHKPSILSFGKYMYIRFTHMNEVFDLFSKINNTTSIFLSNKI